VPYLRHLAAAPENVEALLRFGTTAWNGIDGGAAYGFSHVAMIPPWPKLGDIVGLPRAPGAPRPWDTMKVPADRVHPIPVAYVGNDIDGNLERLYVKDLGIKGAFWANFLNATHVRMAGGAPHLRSQLTDMRVEPLNADGLLVVATDSPLPEDSEENRQRFLRLTSALQPAFLSRADAPGRMGDYLSYFSREGAPMR
jgi:TseV toxin immunity protein TsiV